MSWAYPGAILPFMATFTKDKSWKTLVTVPTITIAEAAGSTTVVSAQNMTEHPAIPGLYRYLLTVPSVDNQNYIGKCTATDSDIDYLDTPSFWVVGDDILKGLEVFIGEWLITFQLYDDGTTDAVDAGILSLVDDSDYPIAWAGVTGNDGQTAFQLDDGDYTLRIRKNDYSFDDVPFTVSGSATITAYGIASPPVSPADIVGNREIAIQTYADGTTDPVPDVLISIVNASSQPVAWSGVTDVFGQENAYLGDGGYEIRARKTGFSFTAVPVTVAGVDIAQTIYGVPYAIDPPIDPGSVAIEEYLRQENGEKYPESVTATLQIIDIPPDINGALLTTQHVSPEYDSLTGTIRWEIPAGVTIQVNIPDHGIRNRKCIVPDVAGIRLMDIPEI